MFFGMMKVNLPSISYKAGRALEDLSESASRADSQAGAGHSKNEQPRTTPFSSFFPLALGFWGRCRCVPLKEKDPSKHFLDDAFQPPKKEELLKATVFPHRKGLFFLDLQTFHVDILHLRYIFAYGFKEKIP